jgi:hypothetical protein
MTGGRIFDAAWIVKNCHRGCKGAIQRIFDYEDAKRPENCGGNACV